MMAPLQVLDQILQLLKQCKYLPEKSYWNINIFYLSIRMSRYTGPLCELCLTTDILITAMISQGHINYLRKNLESNGIPYTTVYTF